MKKTIKLVGMLFMAVLLCVNFTACGGDDDGDVVKPDVKPETEDAVITIGEDGSVSKGHTFAAVDDNMFFLDHVLYRIVDSRLEVRGHDAQLPNNVSIPSSIKFKVVTLNVKTIAVEAFNKCSNLTSITIPNGVTSIEDKAFSRCINLTSITIPNSVAEIGVNAFYSCSSLASITLPNNLTVIGSGTFDGCSSFTSVTIPNGVTKIDYSAFYGCTSLTSITIPNSVTEIGGSAFENCSSLASVAIPNSVTSIGIDAFYHCSCLNSITIPASVKSIGNYAFAHCSNLTSVTNLADNPQTITSGTFSQYGTLHVKPGCGERYKKAESWDKFTIVEDAKEL